MSNITDVIVDVRRGSGSSLEILYGSVIVKPTLAHSRATSIVLPAPSTFDIVDGTVTIPNMQPTPAPDADQMIAWGYTFVFKDRHSKTYEFLVGVPDSVTPVNFTSLPRYAETKSPIWGEGPQGVPGEAATVAVGTVTGGSTAQVTNAGTNTDAVLDFVLPQGPQGPKGDGVNFLDDTKPMSDLAFTYPTGVSVQQSTPSYGWPFNCTIVTHKRWGKARTEQTITETATGRTIKRSSVGGSTSPWTTSKTFAFDDIATTTANGLMSSADKSKLEGITPLANTKTFPALANTYPSGVSIVQVRASDGWPLATTGTVVTHKTATDSTAVGQWLYPVEGGEPLYRSSNASGLWTDFSAVATQSWVKDNAGQAGVINVKDYGAVGDGITDDFEAVRSAFEAVEPGDTVFFPEGNYYTSYKDPSVESNWVVVRKDNVTVSGSGESTVLENFLLYVKGSYGTEIDLAQAPTIGDRTLTTSSAHGLQIGDYVQLLSCVNSYSPDAGTWQLGSASPTDGTRPLVRFTEMVQVAAVTSTTSVRLLSEVVYPKYPLNTVGLSYPMPNIARSTIRKMGMVKGVTIKDLTLKNVNTSSFRQFIARATADMTLDNVFMLSSSLPGASIKISDSYRLILNNCTARKDLDTTGGSSWNSVFIGGGCQEVVIRGFRGYNQAQCIDLTPNNLEASDWGAPASSSLALSTMQFSVLEECEFYGCGDGVTSHPGTYNFTVRNSLFEGGSTGIRARSKRTILQNNSINTARTGIALSAFVHDSLISGNEITIKESSKYTGYWQGISYSMCSSEILNSNDIQNLVIDGNTIQGRTGNAVDTAINLSHTPTTQLAEYDNALKVRRSGITISNNKIRLSSVFVGQYINGTLFEGNIFSGGSARTHYIVCELNSAANYLGQNTFNILGTDFSTGGISTGNVTLTGHGYATTHRIAEQTSLGGLVTNNLTNRGSVYSVGSDYVLRDAVGVTSGGKVFSERSAGSPRLLIDAVPLDGTSNAVVNVFDGNNTSGQKTFRVYGRTYSEDYYFPNFAFIKSDVGDPNGSVSGPIGSLYLRTDGGASSTLYVKTSGTGNTGWTAK